MSLGNDTLLPLVLMTDASDLDWGGSLGNRQIQGSWTPPWNNFHINAKELKSIHFCLEKLQEFLQGLTVDLY